MELSHIINELGEDREHYFNAVAPPMMQTSNFAFRDVKSFRNALKDEYNSWIYSRANNPTVDILRKKLSALDGAEDALVFGSGMGAIVTPILALVSQGDHVISVAKPYSWTIKLFDKILPRFGISVTYVDGREASNFEKAIQPNTKLIYLESPNTFSYELQDLTAVAKLAKAHHIITMIDNSYCSPLYQQPILMGIDLCAQSATKYISGHSDVVAGVVTGPKKLLHHIFENEFMNLGGNISPMNAWLLIRGLRTLEIRLQRIQDSTKKIVDHLIGHPKIDKLLYPYHPSFPQFDLAQKQMKTGGGLFSFALKSTSLQDIETFCNSLQHFLMAVSWGGHESLVFPGAAGFPAEDFDPENLSHKLIRIYVGLEDPDYLIEDLEQALEKI